MSPTFFCLSFLVLANLPAAEAIVLYRGLAEEENA